MRWLDKLVPLLAECLLLLFLGSGLDLVFVLALVICNRNSSEEAPAGMSLAGGTVRGFLRDKRVIAVDYY